MWCHFCQNSCFVFSYIDFYLHGLQVIYYGAELQWFPIFSITHSLLLLLETCLPLIEYS